MTAIFPTNDLQSAQAFLLALRAKGYHPRVVVTDLRRDYGKAIAFPQHSMSALFLLLTELAGASGFEANVRLHTCAKPALLSAQTVR